MKEKKIVKSLRRSYRRLSDEQQEPEACYMLNAIGCHQLRFAIVHETSFVNVSRSSLAQEDFEQFADKIEFYLAQCLIRNFILNPESVCIVNGYFTADLAEEGSLESWNFFLTSIGVQEYYTFETDVLCRDFLSLPTFDNPEDLLKHNFNANCVFLASASVLWHFQAIHPHILPKLLAWSLNTLSPIPLQFLLPLFKDNFFQSAAGEEALEEARHLYCYSNFERDFKLICGLSHSEMDSQLLDDWEEQFPQFEIIRKAAPYLEERFIQFLTVVERVINDPHKLGARLKAEELIIGTHLSEEDLIELII